MTFGFRTPACYITERGGLRERAFATMDAMGLPRTADYVSNPRPQLSPQGAALLRDRETRHARTREEHMHNLQFNINDATRTPHFPPRPSPHAAPPAAAFKYAAPAGPAPAQASAPAPTPVRIQTATQMGNLMGHTGFVMAPPLEAATTSTGASPEFLQLQTQLSQL